MYQRIVVGVANTATSMDAVERARELAATLGATLDIVTAYSGTGDDLAEAERRHAEALVDRLSRPDIAAGIRTHAIPGDAAAAILLVAREIGADLVVVGNKGMHGARRVLRTVPKRVAHEAPCSVLIVDTT